MKKIDFGFNPVSKESQTKKTRIKPTAKQRGEFSKKTITAILERDGNKCVKCGSYQVEAVPHHIQYKSDMGEGTKRNGCTICRSCHDWSHGKKKGPNGEPAKEGRYWFEAWREGTLDENGDYLKED